MIDDSRRRVSQVGKDLIPYFLELFGCKFQFGLIKIQIICRINRNQMHVCMRYFKPNNFNTTTITFKRSFDGFSNRFCKHKHFCKVRSEEHTSELQSLAYLVCRLLLEKKKYR